MPIIATLAPILGKVLDHVIPDPAARAKAVTDILTMFAASDRAQMEVNKAEAASGSLFIAGWRPMIGWTCAGALIYQYIAVPIVSWTAAVFALPMPPLPSLSENLWELTMGMLGMGALRSFEKAKGLTSGIASR